MKQRIVSCLKELVMPGSSLGFEMHLDACRDINNKILNNIIKTASWVLQNILSWISNAHGYSIYTESGDLLVSQIEQEKFIYPNLCRIFKVSELHTPQRASQR